MHADEVSRCVLRARGCHHILAYSGYTYERLRRPAIREPAIGAVLEEIDLLVDGPPVRRSARRERRPLDGKWQPARH